MATINRQAVVVIHGMGEQRPMETLRSFVSGIRSIMTEDDAEKKSTVRSKPDSVGDIYETVRLSLDTAVNPDGTIKRPKTDFYEFYWAHNMRGNQFSHMVAWMHRLLFTWVAKVPPRLRSLWCTVWIMLVLSVLMTIYFTNSARIEDWKKALAPMLAAIAFPSLLALVASFARSLFLNSAGDAARYFTPVPDNIGERSCIRQQGIAFLKKLHELKTVEKVDRIIIVAHSLGTVVAYDLLRLLWTEYNTIYGTTTVPRQPNLLKIDRYYDENSPPPEGRDQAFYNRLIELEKGNLDAFRDLQKACWQEQLTVGNPWLITDFITLGAAINAADYFMVTREPMQELIAQREMPVCPPVKDRKDYAFSYKSGQSFPVGNKNYKVRLLHHGALFAVTRWTNIYYSSDFVGGPMQRKFGGGIKDIMIPRKAPWFFPGGHTAYWEQKDKKNALREILEAMQLDN
ncbi:hypothetical protein ACFQZI_11430 [Mucilaginibacter lutimaris]|uniref:Uncharacterized protein n=1 Tax=Mucilaginibacter lutimaris TaxID=931629 RepID=A0ABW2ZGZ4_9SPHI